VWDPNATLREERIFLPKGRYQLYVVTTGRPVTARIKLPGLSGSTRLSPKARADVTTRDISSTEPPSPAVYSTQLDHNLSNRGLSLVAAELDTDRFVASNFSACIEPSDGEVPAAADEPTCEGGRTAGSGTVTDKTANGGRKTIISMGLLGPGSYEHQLRFRQASLVRSFDARHILLSYETSDRNDDWLYSMSMMW
jgi:hypothetical protein